AIRWQSGAAEATGAAIEATAMPPMSKPVPTAAVLLLDAIPLNFMITSLSDAWSVIGSPS
uniref:hypothetical protein n=1 Tax=Mycolicibacterium gadium TaxID=1794 RepID=UPI0021F280CA